MKIVELLAKITYWNSLFYKPIKLISPKSVSKKINNPKYLFVYFEKEENEIKFMLPNTQIINYYKYNLLKKFFNKKQHIIILNNRHEIADIYRDLVKMKFKVSILHSHFMNSTEKNIEFILKMKK